MPEVVQDIYALNLPLSGTVRRDYSGKYGDNRVFCNEIIVGTIFMLAPSINDNVFHCI